MRNVSLSLLIVLLFAAYSFADDFKIIKKGSYDLSLESKEIKAGSSTVEYFDIDTIDNKIPDQIFTTVESGDWISSLLGNVSVSDKDNNVDKVTEYWEVNFAKVKNGRVIFSRVITNNDSIDRDSYAWNSKLKCRYVKYR